jgi:hypothetical protein
MDGIAQGLVSIDRALCNLDVHNGHVDWSNDFPIICMDYYEEHAARFDRFLPTDYAWRQVVNEGSVFVSHGPIHWGDTIVDESWWTQIGDGAQEVTFPESDGAKWLYVEVLLASATVTVKFADDANYPQHALSDPENLVFRFPLTFWEKTTSEDDPPITLITKTFSLNRYPEIPGWMPPRSP